MRRASGGSPATSGPADEQLDADVFAVLGAEVLHGGHDRRVHPRGGVAAPALGLNADGHVRDGQVRGVVPADVHENGAGPLLDFLEGVAGTLVLVLAGVGPALGEPTRPLQVGEEVDLAGVEIARRLGELGCDHVERCGTLELPSARRNPFSSRTTLPASCEGSATSQTGLSFMSRTLKPSPAGDSLTILQGQSRARSKTVYAASVLRAMLNEPSSTRILWVRPPLGGVNPQPSGQSGPRRSSAQGMTLAMANTIRAIKACARPGAG